MLQSTDDEDGGEEDKEGDGVSDAGDVSVRYLCLTPSPVRDVDLVEGSAELTRRHLKRIRRRDG
jgi:hypothetical protein